MVHRMSQVNDTKIAKEIDIDKNHIDNFVLETESICGLKDKM